MKSQRQSVLSPTRRSIRLPGGNNSGQNTAGGINQRSMSPTGHSFDNMGDEGVSLQAKLFQLEKDLERRQESYITRERAYKVRIDELEEELSAQKTAKTGWMKSDKKISELKAMQGQILNNVELVQDRTARIMQEQERDLLRAFRARLFDVQTELEKEKSKKDDGAAAWIEKSRTLEADVEWAKEVADRLERINQTLLQENSRLKSQFASQEEDRNFLIKQLVAVKKDNARLRAEYTELESESEKNLKKYNEETEKYTNAVAHTVKSTNNMSSAQAMQAKIDSEERYKDVNVRLRRLLAEERKSLQQVRANYASELKVRTDMEMLLRQCVEDVRQEIARRHVESAQFSNHSGNDLAKLYSKQPGLIPVDEFNQEDRERVLELLLSQERVVSLVYAKTFPVTVSNKQQGHTLDTTAGGNSNNNSNTYNEMELNALMLDGGGNLEGSSSPLIMRSTANSYDRQDDHNRPHTASVVAGTGHPTQQLEGGNNARSTSKLPLIGGSRVISR